MTEQSAQGFSIWGEASACRLEFDYEFNATEAIMEFEGFEIVRIELKYCETEDVYCPRVLCNCRTCPRVAGERNPFYW